jgi:predicted exporter
MGALHQPLNCMVSGILLYILRAIWLLPSLAIEASMDPVHTSAQAALAPHQTPEQKESADTTFMEM